METKFTEQQSLALISEMIVQARNNFQKGSGNAIIFNGILVSLCALANVALAFVLPDPNQSCWIWMLMIPGVFITRIIDRKTDRVSMRKTHIDSIISNTWTGFGWAICVLLAVIFMLGFGLKHYILFALINPTILTMTGLAEFITAKACRFKPYFYGAVIMWAGSLLCGLAFWFENTVIIQFFILAICMITGFVIPGYKLNKLAEKHV